MRNRSKSKGWRPVVRGKEWEFVVGNVKWPPMIVVGRAFIYKKRDGRWYGLVEWRIGGSGATVNIKPSKIYPVVLKRTNIEKAKASRKVYG